jgi:hypothetical protein
MLWTFLMLHRLAESFPWLRDAVEFARLGAFLAFLALGLRVVWLQKRARDSNRAIKQLIAYSVAASCLTGLSQIEAWPFTTWALVHNISQKQVIDWKIEGVDGSGKWYAVDARFVEPLPYEDFDTWLKKRFMQLGLTPEEVKVCYLKSHPVTAEQARVANFLVGRMEEARLRFRRGLSPGTDRWALGPLAAPYHFARPPQWRTIADVPSTPFVGMRIWQVDWDVEQRYRNESAVHRHLIFDPRS